MTGFELSKQKGLSMVELMIAISLSLVLTLGVIQIFSSSKQTSRVQNALARLQENARFALDTLSYDIRMAGQLGCNSNAFITDDTGKLRAFGNGIFGYEYSDSLTVALTTDTSDPNPDSNDIIANTDAIIVMRASAKAIPASSTSNTVSVSSADDIDDIDVGDPLVISDCENADLFFAGTRSGSTIPISSSTTFSKTYPTNAELARLNYTAYYVRDDNGQKNLYRSYVNNGGISTEPLLEGVEDLQILYGEDKSNGNGNQIRYVDADQVTNMQNVTSVRIYLLLSTTENNLATTPQNYWFKGNLQQAADGDRRLFRGFTTTIQLRNQGIGL